MYGISAPQPDEVCAEGFSSRYMSRNRKRGWNSFSFTIPAQAKQVPLWPGSPDMRYIKRDEWQFGAGITRRLSYSECAAIQSFPGVFEFKPSLNDRYMQIGNAVPPMLGRAMGLATLLLLEKFRHGEKCYN